MTWQEELYILLPICYALGLIAVPFIMFYMYDNDDLKGWYPWKVGVFGLTLFIFFPLILIMLCFFIGYYIADKLIKNKPIE